MSDDAAAAAEEHPGDETSAPESAEEEALRAQLEEELKKVRVEDVVLQSAASIVNLTARRIAKPDERDLEQARVGIEAVRALAPLLPEEVQSQIRNALSELQMLYAREAGGGAVTEGEPRPAEAPQQPGGRKPPPKLWTPGSS